MIKETKPRWYNLYFAKWLPIKVGELIIVLLATTIVGILCGVI